MTHQQVERLKSGRTNATDGDRMGHPNNSAIVNKVWA
jgi:hypothetical protein